MARKVGGAFVDIVADTDGFEDDLERGLQHAVKQASHRRNFDPLVAAAAQAGADAGDAFGETLAKQMRQRALFNQGRFIQALASPFQKVGSLAADLFFQGFRFTEGAGFLANLSGLLSAFSPAVLSSLSGFLITMGVLVVVVPLVTSAIFALGGALFSLLGVVNILPAGLFGLLASLAPLVIAFQGFGEALGALVSGDLEKFEELLKGLAPSAGRFLREIENVLPFFRELRLNVQEAFFARLGGAINGLVRVLGPALSGGLQNAAFAFGNLFAAIAKFAASPEVANFIANLFQTITDNVGTVTPGVIAFLGALTNAANAGLPVVAQLFGQLNGALLKFAEFVNQSIADGSFQEFLDSGLATLGDLVDVGSEFFGLLKDMFLTTDESGRTFLQDVAEAIKQLREFFGSPEGKEFIENMIVLAEDFGDIMIFVTAIFGLWIGQFAAAIELADDLGEALERLFKKKDLLGDIVRFLSPFGALGFAAEGGITQGPVIAGEAASEAILPLDDPVRARQIAADPAVQNVIGGGDTTVIAIFDGEPFQARITRTVKNESMSNARLLTQKPRVGV